MFVEFPSSIWSSGSFDFQGPGDVRLVTDDVASADREGLPSRGTALYASDCSLGFRLSQPYLVEFFSCHYLLAGFTVVVGENHDLASLNPFDPHVSCRVAIRLAPVGLAGVGLAGVGLAGVDK